MTPFDWHGFLNLAKQLASTNSADVSAEACYRTAVGRAYYATFLLAREVARRAGVPLSATGQEHTEVRAYLRGTKNPSAMMAATKLNTLHIERKKCDYEDAHTVDAKNTRLLCALAESTISIIDSL